MPAQIGSKTVDGSLSDWDGVSPLFRSADPGQFALWGETDDTGAILAVGGSLPVGGTTTFWLDTDLNPATGYRIWGFAGGAEYNVEIGADGSATLYSGGPGQTFVADLEVARSADKTALEIALPRDVLPFGTQLRVLADVNNTVFLPNDYSNISLIAGPADIAPVPPVAAGEITLDGDLGDWAGTDPLFTAAGGETIRGTVSGGSLAIALEAPVRIGGSTTVWLDTDLDRGTGFQIFGFTGGAEYNVEIASDGSAALYTGGAGQTFVADLDVRMNADGTVAEIAVPTGLAGIGDAVRFYADINNQVFLPNDFANVDLVAGTVSAPEQPTGPVPFGTYTIDGAIGDFGADELLFTAGNGARLYGDVIAEGGVFAVSAPGGVGATTTIWLDTDLDRATGYQVFGSTVGAEYNIEIGADGSAALYQGGAGQTLVAPLDARSSADGTTIEVALPRGLAALGDEVRVFADVNNQTFLPGDYATGNLIAGTPALPATAPDLRVGIVYSETTAQNWFNLTNYGQLVMSAQNQAMQAGIPFDLLGEADLTDAAKLAQYDALVFPGFANVPAADVDAIARALDIAARAGTGLIAAGNFMTNDETGAALPGNSYARMQALLGVTLDGFGTTQGIDVIARGGANPILDDYVAGATVDSYETLTAYQHFRDVTGSGEVLFDQRATLNGVTTTEEAAIATTVNGGRNVHFATDAVIGNSNILHEAIDWVAKDDAGTADVGLSLSRNESLFYSRNDMDLSQEYYDVVVQNPGVYDVLLPILEDWKARYDFVGSYYVNVGANPPDLQTDWTISRPYYQRLLDMGNEIGSHSYTHPDDTNLLMPDNAAILDLAARVVPGAAGSVLPWQLTVVEQALLANSFRFQFETSKLMIEQQLGIDVTGAAVPGAPESLATSREIIRFYDYMSGGYAGEGAGYPGAFGYLTPDLQDSVYLAPNMSFDFSLIQFQNRTPAEALAIWNAEFTDIVTNGETPIVAFPWHDYGPTEWSFDNQASQYTYAMFEEFIARADAAGTEFVTGEDLAQRIATFEDSALTVSRAGDVITATVDAAGPATGRFALNVGEQVSSVANWYAWDGEKVFLDRDGGTFEVAVGEPVADVTRLSALPDRAELISVSGDGRALRATFEGAGTASIELGPDWGRDNVVIRGVDGGTNWTGTGLDVILTGATTSLSVDYVGKNTRGTSAAEVMIGGSEGDLLAGRGGADVMVGGAGADDFVFRPGTRGATVLDFEPNSDDLIFEYSLYSGYHPWIREIDLVNSFVDYDGGTRLMAGNDVVLTLEGVSRAQLDTLDVDIDFTFFLS